MSNDKKETEKWKKVVVFGGASENIDNKFKEEAGKLGKLLTKEKCEIIYGAGYSGLMGAIAKECTKHNGRVIGVIPKFMVDNKWHYKKCTKMIVTETMHERKANYIKEPVEMIIALAGGVGTLEELMEMITWKQLGLIPYKICVLNTLKFYEPFKNMINGMEKFGFISKKHKDLFRILDTPEEIISYLKEENTWKKETSKHIIDKEMLNK